MTFMISVLQSREMSDQLVLKASKVFLALKVLLESLEKRVLLVLLVSLERLDVLELAENVVILEREDPLESRDLKVNHLLYFL